MNSDEVSSTCKHAKCTKGVNRDPGADQNGCPLPSWLLFTYQWAYRSLLFSRGELYSHQSTTMKLPCILYVGMNLSTRGNRFNLRILPVRKIFPRKVCSFSQRCPRQTVVVLLHLVNIREFPAYERSDAHNEHIATTGACWDAYECWASCTMGLSLDTWRRRSTCVSSHTSLTSGNIERRKK